MAIKRLDHIAIAVPNLEESLEFYTKQLGMSLITIETVEEQGVRVAKIDAGNTHIELLEPLSAETPVGRFLAKRGSGLHHICMGVDDIVDQVSCLVEANVDMIDKQPKIGASGARIAFVHPRATGGVLLELSQPVKEHH